MKNYRSELTAGYRYLMLVVASKVAPSPKSMVRPVVLDISILETKKT